jgi:hypothetical protein
MAVLACSPTMEGAETMICGCRLGAGCERSVDRRRTREDVHNRLPTALLRALGVFVRFTLDDGSEVLFESAESDLVALHSGPPDVRDGGKLTARL